MNFGNGFKVTIFLLAKFSYALILKYLPSILQFFNISAFSSPKAIKIEPQPGESPRVPSSR